MLLQAAYLDGFGTLVLVLIGFTVLSAGAAFFLLGQDEQARHAKAPHSSLPASDSVRG